MKKTCLTLLLCTILAVGSAVPALAVHTTAAAPAAQSTVTAEQALATAKKYVPADSIHTKTENERTRYEIRFYSKERQESYDVDISRTTGKLIAFDSDADAGRGDTTVTLSEADAKKVVENEIADITAISTRTEWDDGFAETVVTFTAKNCYGKYKLHPQTGRVLDRDIIVGTAPSTTPAAPVAPAAPAAPATSGNSYIGIERATQLALNKAPAGAVLDEIEFDRDDGRAVYEGKLVNGRWEYEFKIDAVSGSFLEWEEDYDD